MNKQHQKNDSQIVFFMQVLQLSLDSDANHEIVYPVLQENLDKIDQRLVSILRNMAEHNQLNAEAAYGISGFSSLIQMFPLGNKANNIEIAIAGYEVASRVYAEENYMDAWGAVQYRLADAYFERIKGQKVENLEKALDICLNSLKYNYREISPELWAYIKLSLGKIYIYRIEGDKGENLENAINTLNQALEVVSYNIEPHSWASIQNGLGTAYLDRIKGNHSDNVEFAVKAYQQALKVRTYDLEPYGWAQIQNNLGQAYLARIQGNREENIELAIAAYKNALEVFTIETDPQTWAMVKNNLANAYSRRIKGGAAENLELAIEIYEDAALQVYTRDAFPLAWAKLKTDLARTYKTRIIGNPAQNQEKSIAACEEALEIRNRKADAYTWAETLYTLAETYIARINGSRAENIDKAIFNYHQALQIYTLENDARTWATIQNELANAYRLRILGERAENLEQSLIACQQALQVRIREVNPQTWAASQRYLALAYLYRVRGNREENLELAISACEEALKIYACNTFPTEWADVQNDLGVIYEKRIRGDRAENLEFAIQIYKQVLQEVYTREDFPRGWAGTLSNLALAYTLRIQGNKADNLEKGIDAYHQVLQIFTREELPQDWATTQHNLALAYYERIKGKRLDNLNKSITACYNALEIYDSDAFIQERATMHFYLGNAYLDANNFSTAYHAFNKAIESVDYLREEVHSGEEIKQKIAERWYQLYQRMLEACLELGKIKEALEYAERSKTRNLVELILNRDRKTIFSSKVVIQLEKLRDEINISQYKLQNAKAENPIALVQHLQQLRKQRKELQDKYLPIGSSFNFNQFQTTLDEKTAVIEWYITGNNLETFIITRSNLQRLNTSKTSNNLDALGNWNNEYLNAYYNQKFEWKNNLDSRLTYLAEILQLEELLKLIPKTCTCLILIPHRYLHLFPLHALPLINGELFSEKFPDGVSYAPSCQLLQQVQQRKRADFQNLFAIQNPTEDLNYTNLEVEVIQSYFNTANVLKKSAATVTAVNNSDLNTYHCVHFSCHGYFNLLNPAKSALILANASIADTSRQSDSERYLKLRAGEAHDLEKCLTLDKIFSLKLEICRLVTLSACETGLIDFNNTSDEYIGLPSGFLLAGSPSVVSSLWKVDDLSTSFLMIKFYENLTKLNKLKAGSIALALNQAQKWLRNLDIEELDKFLEQYKAQIEQTLAQLRVGQRLRFQESLKLIKQRQPLPCANPYYWAGFIASGF
ncbi:CHAT domain-containing protein [Plectonema cf. radiosum LEGE 06105]|uniref:CHAT domain-containing protein n=1 Tax=Plectonema cf. radiosum LEGE 06105 TaxID=945769 RepID=A0A8J7F4K7_9CYAN|nr:CHAT domain-containing protein [Plectonema radiosum]MBE9214965.1 CHAT domain-containing protein [Plectonema cf. radiosum LEGE 06105]